MQNLNDLRIRRFNSRNLVLERKADKTHRKAKGDVETWIVIGYFSKPEDMAATLIELATDTPEGDSLIEQIANLTEQIKSSEQNLASLLSEIVV